MEEEKTEETYISTSDVVLVVYAKQKKKLSLTPLNLIGFFHL